MRIQSATEALPPRTPCHRMCGRWHADPGGCGRALRSQQGLRSRPRSVAAIALVGWPYNLATFGRNEGHRADLWRAPILPGVSADARVLTAQQGAYPIIVLPFTAGRSRARRRSLADRVSDDLTNELSRVHALRVIARATARVRGTPDRRGVAGKRVGARYVVEGSVQLHEERLSNT